MKPGIRFVLSSFLICILLTACGPSEAEQQAAITQIAADIFSTQTAQAPTSTATFTPSPTATLTPTSTATPTPTLTSTETPTPRFDLSVLFMDDFSDKSGKWDRVNVEGEGITDYANGAYQIRVETANMDVWANPNEQSFTDVRVEVDAQKVAGGTDNNDFGVICRYKDESNFYFFIISSDGYYGIGKVKDGTQELIGMDNMRRSGKVNLGDATNQIRADCVGSTLTLYINGQQVDSKTDSDFTEGNVGLIAGTFEDIYTDILFDNFKVLKP